jgi:mitochondrial import receptor subunit TOM40
MHGIVDTNGVFQGKYHYNLTKSLAARFQSQVSRQPGQSMLQSELDYAGPDYSLNVKAINPDVAGQTGIVTGSFLQAVGKHLSLGAELIAQRMQPGEPTETGINIGGKYATDVSTTTVNVQQFAALQASYFHRVSDKVELGTELQLLLAGPRSDAVTTVAAKFDYRQACIRTQLDSTGKVALLFEEKLFPGFSLLMAGEIDHAKASSRFGLGVNLEN